MELLVIYQHPKVVELEDADLWSQWQSLQKHKGHVARLVLAKDLGICAALVVMGSQTGLLQSCYSYSFRKFRVLCI